MNPLPWLDRLIFSWRQRRKVRMARRTELEQIARRQLVEQDRQHHITIEQRRELEALRAQLRGQGLRR